MKLIKSGFEIIQQGIGLEGIQKQIEIAGRTCYKSENNITENSYINFVDMISASGHNAILEFGTVYLKIKSIKELDEHVNDKYILDPYSKVNKVKNIYYITTNYRVIIENLLLEDLKFLCEPTEFHEKRIHVKFICDRAIANEVERHRAFSYAQESTRYCNYSKDKFNKNITYIIPSWENLKEGTYIKYRTFNREIKEYNDYILNNDTKEIFYSSKKEYTFLDSCIKSEDSYLYLTKKGYTAQQARLVLPLALKTELHVSGFTSDWKRFFELRCANNAHPQMRELAIPLQDVFKERKFI